MPNDQQGQNNYGGVSGGVNEWGGVSGPANTGTGSQYNNYYTNANRPSDKLFVGVPPRPEPFVGRVTLLTTITEALSSGSASLSTHGLGGMGKTALATMLAYSIPLLDRFSDGVLWASLGPTPDLDRTLNEWGDALGCDVRGLLDQRDKIARLRNAIGQRPLLIILDDMWDRSLVRLLRQLTGPRCAQLLTCRDETLAHDFAPTHAYDVDELDREPAIDLLAALCPSAKTDRATLGQLAATVGDHPLALKLVGGYLFGKVLLAKQLGRVAAELRQSEQWMNLRDDDRDANLGQILALSLDALPDEAHRAAFLHLAAFAPKPASFTLDAALAVIAPDEPDAATDIFTTLVRRNLVEQPPDSERFDLHQILHALATARCADLPAARRAHADFYLKLMNADRNDWQSIEAEWEQIQPAWAWVSTTPDAEDLVLNYIGAARQFQVLRGYWRELMAWHESGVAVARAAGNQKEAATLLSDLGWVHSSLGEKQQALDYYQQAMPIWIQVGDRAGEATTLNNIGRVYNDLGDQQQALDYLQQALPIRRQVGDRSGEASTLNNIGLIYNDLGDQQQALDYLQQALPICQQVGDRAAEATTLNNIGGVYDGLGDKQQALTYYQQALPISRQVGERSGEGVTANNIGYIYLDAGDWVQARSYLELALAIGEQVQYPDLIKVARAGLEEVQQRVGG